MAARRTTSHRKARVRPRSANDQARRPRRRLLWSVAILAPFLALAALLLRPAWSDSPSSASEPPRATTSTGARSAARLRVDVVESYPHDPAAFTQGLLLEDGVLYESTGLSGQSSLREVELETGRVLRRLDIPAPEFAEGLALVGQRLVQLTYTSGRAFEYELDTFERQGELTYSGEGWGLCYDGSSLVMSNGSDRLTYRDPESFAVQRELSVTRDESPLVNINELECVGDSVYANVWNSETIVRIEGSTGRVTEQIDASGLLSPDARRSTDVLNGIAYDGSTKTFLITGKLWPRLFRVRFVPTRQS
ncbi:MAG: glutaminyl-peptide cyclotransferase [Luteitalea sp.]|nr:glutaminyl-peptide cyclotransferase [Luteitalea sp.]